MQDSLKKWSDDSNDEKEEFVPTFKSTYPENRPSEQEWMNEFRFGMLYDRKVIYMD